MNSEHIGDEAGRVQDLTARLPHTPGPWQYGHGETKATCLWLKNLPRLRPTDIVEGRSDRIHKMPPGPNRWKERSRTYQGIADAMAQQWGDWLIEQSARKVAA